MPTNITYLFGAGASYNAVPLVKELSKAFRIIAEKIEETNFEHGHGGTRDEFESSKRKFIKLLIEAALKGETFGSIDGKFALTDPSFPLDTDPTL